MNASLFHRVCASLLVVAFSIASAHSSDIVREANGWTYSRSAYHRGRADAARDIANGTLAVEEYGLPADFQASDIYRRILQQRYHITLRRVAGCEPDDAIVGHARGYNEVSQREIAHRYGRNLLDRVYERAEKLASASSHK
jgi:hypothetical protein